MAHCYSGSIPMRGARWLLLLAIAAILGGALIAYRAQRKTLRDNAAPAPQPLPPGLSSSAEHYKISQSIGNRKVFDLEAEDYRQSKDSSRVDLRGVRLKLFSEDAGTYDLITSAAATLSTTDNRFYSDGDVEITIGAPADGSPAHSLVSIKSAGIALDPATGKADTDRPSTFVFQNGEGSATGASYDPASRVLEMKKDVHLNWRSPKPGAEPMTIEAESLTYLELESEIRLRPWGRLKRGAAVIEGRDAVVRLKQVDGPGGSSHAIQQITAAQATGTDAYPNRKLAYNAAQLQVDFNDEGAIQTVRGNGGAQMTSSSPTGETSVRSDVVAMTFSTQADESALDRIAATGNAVVTSKPLPIAGAQPAETRVLRSNDVDMKMRAGGREMESLVTRGPGTLEFFPNAPSQRHRTLDGNNLAIAYGPRNAIESFRATDAKTQTDPTEDERKRNRALAITRSRELVVRFDLATGRMTSMEQSGDFSYDEADRRARAAQATLDAAQDVIVLRTSARVWDSTGSTAADLIRLNQTTGDFSAEGQVRSSRLADKQSPQMLAGEDPIQAQARKMQSTNRNRSIHYEGDAVMWQGANRIQGDTLDIDREKRILTASGNVITNLWEQPAAAKPAAAPVLTVVRAQKMVYTDADRLAVYTGGVKLVRPGLAVDSRDLRANLGQGGGSQLEKAFADGNVRIVQDAPARRRTGTGDHAEYYSANQKIVLRGGNAKLVDSVKGSSEGAELTYYANDDRLLGSGAPGDPVKSRVNRDHK